ncbi:MAG TPA: ABC transporter permease [Atribacteraceae bacterium]|nr:ABC transporter permease [Atribacteraceae bacterium]
MNLLESFRTATYSLSSNKLRSFLTMLGVIIGVAAVVSMVSLGQGARVQITQQIGDLGSNVLTVAPGRFQMRPGGMIQSGADVAARDFEYSLYQDLERVAGEELLPHGIRSLMAESRLSSIVSHRHETVKTTIVGTTPNYPDIQNFRPSLGRFFSLVDLEAMNRVAVLGSTVAEELFGESNFALGQSVRIGNVNFTVIGVMEPKSEFGQDLGDRVLVPITTTQKRLTGSRLIQSITVQTVSTAAVPQTESFLNWFFTRSLGGEEHFSVFNQQSILDTITEVTGTITFLLGGITGISLLVGGIGIMNIMLVSVTERTREIGLRKAVGARPSDILLQFLIESSVLSGLGGIIGIILGIVTSRGIARLSQWETLVSIESVVIAFGVSLAVGLFFGIFPARRASRMDPINALRYE